MISFSDIFKSSYLDKVASISILDMVLSLALAFCLGMFIFLIYKKTYQGVMYSSSFGDTLVAVTMISTLVILAVTSNVVLSLGMVGALSIVRFRTAVKDVMDTVFMFWAIVNGIICGAGFVLISIIANLGIGLLILAVFYFGKVGRLNLYLVVVRTEAPVALTELSPLFAGAKLKSCSSAGGLQESVAEMKLSAKQIASLRALTQKNGVKSVDIVAYDTKTGL